MYWEQRSKRQQKEVLVHVIGFLLLFLMKGVQLTSFGASGCRLFCFRLIGWCTVSRVLARMKRTEQTKFHTQSR